MRSFVNIDDYSIATNHLAYVKDIIMEKDDQPVWSKIGFRIVLNVVTHPLDYAKTLIQIGYEPIDPRQTTSIFGKPVLGLPNIFQYVSYIKSVDGLTGCYRGLAPRLCANAIYAIAYDKAVSSVEFEDEPDDSVPIDELEDHKRDKKYVQDFFRTLIGRTVAIVCSHPLEVVTVRMMAQFVGGETKYDSIIGSFGEIYKENGISGFFAGLVPKLVASFTTLVIVNTSTYVLNKYFIHDRELRGFMNATVTFLASTFTYPFLVVSQCMAVNKCGLTAGELPMMPVYADWTDCWKHLSRSNQLKRGSSLFFRYYTGPQVIINGRPVVDKSNRFFKKID
ncbi:mitochondrial carrier homolog 2-like [Trichogramma pretiosum]|uniref:mitochondrial carrier homolog 2-like n=1 Tax=Trichogramma pretiosum TaxID=7493 RepID=UPI0006C944DC|nr:mitochondrial carrier homolog 2-like [Trichogramma pretiosum]